LIKPKGSGRKDGVACKLGYWLLELVEDFDAKNPLEIACSSLARKAISPPNFFSLPSSTKINSVWFGSSGASPFSSVRGWA